MEVKEIEQGIHPDGVKWRIRKIGGWYYYSEQLEVNYDAYTRWGWFTNYIHTNLDNVRDKVALDSRTKEEYIQFMKKGKCNG